MAEQDGNEINVYVKCAISIKQAKQFDDRFLVWFWFQFITCFLCDVNILNTDENYQDEKYQSDTKRTTKSNMLRRKAEPKIDFNRDGSGRSISHKTITNDKDKTKEAKM